MAASRTLVVGSGAGGLTLALLLARTGRAVTLAEIQPEIGGYLRRFTRKGLRWDTGYHFSGGFTGVMAQMFQALGIADTVAADPIENRIVLNDLDRVIHLPAGCGVAGAEAALCEAFPSDAAALRKWTAAIREIWDLTPMHDLRDLTPPELTFSQYDLTTVRSFSRTIGLSPAAELAAASFATCHGSPLTVAPMSFHGRVGFSLWDDLARPRGGGDPFIAGFRREAAKLDVEILTSAELLRFAEPDAAGECHTAVFADGRTLAVDEVYFTMHPSVLSQLMPKSGLTPSLRRRLGRLRETNALFCAYYAVDDPDLVTPGLVLSYSGDDLDAILRGDGSGDSTGYMLDRERDAAGREFGTVAAFRVMPPGTPAGFAATRRERLEQPEYQAFKSRMSDEIAASLCRIFPALRGHLRPVESGTPLTCRDYDPPTGSAYGAICVCGEARLCGRLPVRNFHLAGQSALVPGVMGTMLASFAVFRSAVGEDAYRRLIRSAGVV